MDKIYVTKSTLPDFDEYASMIKELWDTHIVTNMGMYHKKLEEELKNYMGVRNISLMVNGHMALEMAIQAFDFPRGSEVITTPFTFISTTHAIVRNGLEPIFCDINTNDFTIDVSKIESLINEKTVAIIPVHVYGNICNVEEIEKIAYKYGIKVIYDACHAFGETQNGIGIGNFGDASVFSFHATKVFNTIEGGAVTFSDDKMYEKLYNLKNFGIRNEEMIVGIGANAKMNEFCAIMGLANLKTIDENIRLRKLRCEQYCKYLKKCSGIILPNFEMDLVKRNYSYYYVMFQNEQLRDCVYNELRDNDIYSRKYFYPITSEAACFRRKYVNLNMDNARNISKRVLVLPLYPELEEEAIKRICDIILKVCNSIGDQL